MKKLILKIMAMCLILVLAFSFSACGEEKGESGKKDKNTGSTKVPDQWYLGGNNILTKVDPEEVFKDVKDSIEPEKIYNKVEYTAEMLHGSYALVNQDKDVKKVREEIPFEDVEFFNGTQNITVLPIAVYMGKDNIASSATNYKYGEFDAIDDNEVAVISFATKDKIGNVICIYDVEGNTITFENIQQTSKGEEPFAYETTGIKFEYEFEICGPYLTLKKGDNSIKLLAYCFTQNTDNELWLSGYSLPTSPLIDELDYFSSSDTFNYAVRRDGSYYDISTFKIDAKGIFTAYLADKSISGEKTEFIQQYAYIIQSSADSFLTMFSIVLLDGEKTYYYTDDITQREARILEDQGIEVEQIEESKIEEIAEKKEDLFEDLYKEFSEKGINVTINRSTGEMAMDASVLFGGNSSKITDEGKKLLNQFLQAYTSIIYNEKYDGFIAKTLVEGHTAPLATSTYESGLPLSTERAENVKAYCLSTETGIDTTKLATTLEAVGLSNSKPVYGNDGEINLEACRRVSFRFIVNVEN